MFNSDKLNTILKAELGHGNHIVENSHWPPKCVKLVILENKFSRRYDDQTLEFAEINDPHYWFAEYRTKDGSEMLACKAKEYVNIVPNDKFGFDTCENLARASDAQVNVHMLDLLEWLADMNWPVAAPVLERLKTMGDDLIEPVRTILNGHDLIWKYWMLAALLPATQPSIIGALKPEIRRFIDNPSPKDIEEELHIVARECLEHHREQE